VVDLSRGLCVAAGVLDSPFFQGSAMPHGGKRDGEDAVPYKVAQSDRRGDYFTYRPAFISENLAYCTSLCYNSVQYIIGGGDMPQIRPITDLRKTSEISEICNSKKEPVFITKKGYGDLVIMSIATYESMLEISATDTAIAEAETEYAANNRLHDAKEALQTLRRKHFG